MIRRAASTTELYAGARRVLVWKLAQSPEPSWWAPAYYWKLTHVVWVA